MRNSMKPQYLDDSRNLLQEGPAAAFLGCSPRSLQKWRQVGGGPAFVKIGGRLVRYRQADLDEFLLAGRRRSTSEIPANAA